MAAVLAVVFFGAAVATAQPPAALPVLGGATEGGPVKEEGKINLNFTNPVPLTTVLRFTEQQGLRIVLRGKAADNTPVAIVARNDDPETVLTKLVGPRDWVWYRNPQSGMYELWDKPTFEQEVLPTLMIDKVFTVEHLQAGTLVPALQGLINADKGGSISVDERTNKVFVRDLPEVVQQISRLIDDLDVNLTTRVFRIRHADVQEIADKLAVYKSAPGTIDPDIRTRQIVVTDIEQNIKRMELLVDVLDVGPELRVYDLNNIGFEGSDIEEVEAAIEEVLTEGAFYQINYRSGTLIVQDVDEVHEKIEQILAAFDPPQKQVLIEAEIIETNFENSFEYSLDVIFSEDLFAASFDELVDIEKGVGEATAESLGFVNFRETFPIVGAGGGGVSLLNLSSKARLELKAALEDSETQILQQPRLLVKNHETATIEVGRQLPFANTLPSTGDNNQVYSQIQTVRVGLFVEISPSISNNGMVEIELSFENNDGTPVTILSNGEQLTAIETTTQEIETTLVIPSGETRMIGGLIRDGRSESVSGVPILSKLPIIGPFLFGSFLKDDSQRHIMVFITPTIIEERPQRGRVYSRPFTQEQLRAIQTGVVDATEELDVRGRSAFERPGLRAEDGATTGSEMIDGLEVSGATFDQAELELLQNLDRDGASAPADGSLRELLGDIERGPDPASEPQADIGGEPAPGAQAEYLNFEGRAQDDAAVRDTLTEAGEFGTPGEEMQSSYSSRLRGAASTAPVIAIPATSGSADSTGDGQRAPGDAVGINPGGSTRPAEAAGVRVGTSGYSSPSSPGGSGSRPPGGIDPPPLETPGRPSPGQAVETQYR